MSRSYRSLRRWILVALGCGLFLLQGGAGSAAAQGLLPSLFDPRSPLVWIPPLQGEVTFTPIWVSVLSGKQTVPSLGLSWDMRRDFHIKQPELFLDTMVRIQAGRLGLRCVYELRDFTGTGNFQNLPNHPAGENRIDYSGIRIGADFDLYQRWLTRFGFDLDYNIYQAIFTETTQTLGGKKIQKTGPVTWGVHGSYNPVRTFFGASFICDACIRFPLLGAELTDWRVSAGLRSPETILGSWALKGGYRQSNLKFKDGQFYNGLHVATDFDVTMGGWFLEFAYYY
jgi:hypothetical protein